MPKRVIDFDAMWASDKLAACEEWAQAEYAWFYGLADASGSFELTNLRVIWGRVAAVRRNLTLERVTEIFEEFMQRGLLFTWEQNGKRYGHWTGSDVPGRLPPPSWRMRLERLAPPVPREKLAAYLARYGGQPVAPDAGSTVRVTSADESSSEAADKPADESSADTSPQLDLNLGIESAQAQEWDGDLNWKKKEGEVEASASNPLNADRNTEAGIGSGNGSGTKSVPRSASRNEAIELMVAVYEAERGSLPPAGRCSVEVRRQCLRRLAEGLTLEDFRAAVRGAAATPFLAGAGGARLVRQLRLAGRQ